MSSGEVRIRSQRAPREIFWGRGSLAQLAKSPQKRALLVTDKTMISLGYVEQSLALLKQAGVQVKVFSEVEPEPSINTVMRIVKEYTPFNPDLVIGLGGGSVIDASKAFRIFFEYPELKFEEVRYFGGPPKKQVPPFTKTVSVAIPSTSGTGSEVSWGCVITDPSIPAKCSTNAPAVIPDIAILDPNLADSMPKTVLADTGLDALTHAVSAHTSLNSNDFSRAASLKATALLMKYLPAAYQGDSEAKEHVHYAASLAGQGIPNAGIGVDHVIAALVGGKFHLTHGRACAITLPTVIAFNAPVAAEGFLELARAIGYPGFDSAEGVAYLSDRLLELNRALDMPSCYSGANIPEAEYMAELEGFIEKSPGFPMMQFNPRKCSADDFRQLYTDCFFGND